MDNGASLARRVGGVTVWVFLFEDTDMMNGTTILHYKLGEKLGSGGMGDVFRAEDTRLGRPVALKFLSTAHRNDPEKRSRLFQEARAASALKSPNIAVTYDVVEHGEHLFIVMELVEGELLSHKLDRGALPVPDVLSISTQTAEALADAHSHGVIHRDIKAANIMVTPRGSVKVLDFGIAKILAPEPGGPGSRATTWAGAQLTSPGMILGTVSYMSPEQALGRVLDHRSDIFSLGVLMYQLTTGRLPFEGETMTHIIDRILHHEPTPAALLNREVPAALSLLIQHAMEKDLSFRCASAGELAGGLRKLSRALELRDDLAGLGLDKESKYASGSRSPLSSLEESSALVNAVAVLTFSNITREPGDEWIGTGIAETVTADLQNVEGLAVIGRARVYEVLKGLSSSDLSVPDERVAMDLGRRLGATWIVRGGYQRMGEVIRITAHFGEVKTGKLLNTVKVDGRLSDIFQLQDRIVYALTQGLHLNLAGTEIARIEKKETQSVEAYERYSRAMLNLRTGDRDSLDRGIQLFEKALELDPAYAAAWAGLASANVLKGGFLGSRDLIEKAVAQARKAIELNPHLPAAHAWLGSALNALGRFEEADPAIEEAIRLDASNPTSHLILARILWVGKGRIKEGIAALEKCVALNPEFGHAYLQLAFLHSLQRNLDRAEEAARKATELQERSLSGSEGLRIVGGHTRLGYVHYLRGAYPEAIREYEKELEFLTLSDHALRERTLIELQQKLGAAWLRAGDRGAAVKHLERAVKSYSARRERGYEDPFTTYYIACAHALLGEDEKALESLSEAIQRLSALNRQRAAADPDLESLRGHPAFQKLLGMGTVGQRISGGE